MGTRTFDGVRFAAWSDEHLPMHVHGFYGGIEVVVEMSDGVARCRGAKMRFNHAAQSGPMSIMFCGLQQSMLIRSLHFGEYLVGKWTMVTTDAEIDAAIAEAKLMPPRPIAISASYIGGSTDVIAIRLDTGGRLTIPREYLQGLENATAEQCSQIEIWAGVDICWPQLDLDHYLPYLLEHRYGSKKWMESLRLTGVAA